jgi:hypothetical protein
MAAAPSLVPVQGLLTDPQGQPLEGPVTISFSLYDSQGAGTALWTESQQLTCWMGLFSAYLGAVTPLDLSLFRDQAELWLGIQVSGDSEMPRILVGSTPYAGFAQYASYTGGEGIVITPANIISSILGSSVEADEISDGAVTSAAIQNGTILREDLAQDGCQTGQFLQWNGTGWNCADLPSLGMLSGQVNHGDTIPLPPGFTQDRCHWIVTPRNVGLENDRGMDHVICSADADRLVRCTYSIEDNTDHAGCTANYLIICQ